MALGNAACVVCFVNVGQGDCTIAVDASGDAVMIDCPSWGYGTARDVLEGHGVAVLDSFMVSHWDQDHWSGLPRVLSDLKPRLVAYNLASIQLLKISATSEDDRSRAALALRSLKKGRERGDFMCAELCEGFEHQVGDVELEALAPNFHEASDALVGSRVDKNLASAVVMLACHGFRAVIGGDAPARVWARLQNEYETLDADVLRSPHHGSMSVAEGLRLEAFGAAYDWLAPSEVVHSVGTGGVHHGHPNPEAVEAAGSRGIRVLCTSVTTACCDRGDLADSQCAGTVEIRVDTDGSWARTPTEAEHAATVDSWGPKAMCRRWGGAPSV